MKFILPTESSSLFPVNEEFFPDILLKFTDKEPLIKSSYKTALSFTDENNIAVITNTKFSSDIKNKLLKLTDNPLIISESCVKNTAVSFFTAIMCLNSDDDDIIIIFPAYIKISDLRKFKTAVKNAVNVAEKGYFVILAEEPKQESINDDNRLLLGNELSDNVYVVDSFYTENSFEKTDDSAKNIFLNTGIYISKSSVIKNAYKRFAGDIFLKINKEIIDENNITDYSVYEKLPDVSFEKLILKNIRKKALVKIPSICRFYNSWNLISEYEKKDPNNNLLKGKVLIENVKDSFVYSTDNTVVVTDTDNISVIETEDTVLVCDKSYTDTIADKLKFTEKYRISQKKKKTGFRPWGISECIANGKDWETNILSFYPQSKMPLHSHKFAKEHITVLEGVVSVILNNSSIILNKGQSIDISEGTKHSIQNPNNTSVKLLKFIKGELSVDNDTFVY